MATILERIVKVRAGLITLGLIKKDHPIKYLSYKEYGKRITKFSVGIGDNGEIIHWYDDEFTKTIIQAIYDEFPEMKIKLNYGEGKYVVTEINFEMVTKNDTMREETTEETTPSRVIHY